MKNTNTTSACGYTSDGCYGNCQACLSAEVCPVFNDTGTAEAQVELNQDGTFVRLGQAKRLFKTVVPKTTVILIAGIIPAQIKGRYIPNNLQHMEG